MDTVTIKSTKADLFKAYEEMRDNFDRAKREQILPMSQQAEVKRQEEKVLEKTSGLVPETLENDIISLKKKAQNNLEDLKNQLIEESQKLNDLKKAIEIETAKLEEIHNVKLAADTLQALINEYETKDRELAGKSAEEEAVLDEKISNRKKEWEREQEEYNYNLKINRKKEQDEYSSEQARKQFEWQAGIDKKELEIFQREEIISKKEAEFEDLKKQAEGFPKKLENAVKEARQETEKELQREFSVQKQLSDQQHQGEKMMLEAKIESLLETIKNQFSEIASLKKSLSESSQRAQDLASAVIQNAGYKQAQAEMAKREGKEG